ncbi:hypothetical protein COW38_03435 [Candidatus Collierbacteria bacterium CG17_big_fil_post_rev_8_21_14_2_50_45_7]|uniref:Uncharacterized protein n=1 Tax=Candidatus Collierbacteria bacterium CG17_big_fil_post_rev_8_21_14_2_50_45_7 TaxID=1974536 RepID=A0A2M7FMA2_9BACT|nr:MAG: hypothetical protein COW38_03435 [Candidatus Collierbacteria bacterium CG17_big_fil_post_rev_8_21_14_2_50_45_7]
MTDWNLCLPVPFFFIITLVLPNSKLKKVISLPCLSTNFLVSVIKLHFSITSFAFDKYFSLRYCSFILSQIKLE